MTRRWHTVAQNIEQTAAAAKPVAVEDVIREITPDIKTIADKKPALLPMLIGMVKGIKLSLDGRADGIA